MASKARLTAKTKTPRAAADSATDWAPGRLARPTLGMRAISVTPRPTTVMAKAQTRPSSSPAASTSTPNQANSHSPIRPDKAPPKAVASAAAR